MTNGEKWPPLKKLPEVGEVYLHLNGLAYTVIALAVDNQREELQVIHQGADGCVWSRPIGNFMGVPSGHGARFRLNQSTDAG
jgi:hypothetical protein